MADEDQAHEGAQSAEADSEGIPIIRDPSFVRLAPDMTLIIDRGRDIEIAMLVQGPDPAFQAAGKTLTESYEMSETRMRASYSEIGRVRLTAGQTLNLAMNVIEANLKAGRVNVVGFRTALEALLAAFSDESDTPVGPASSEQQDQS